MRQHQFSLSSVAITPENIERFDCVLLATDHDRFDYDAIASHAKLLVDCRGRMTNMTKNIIRA
jgi:UDP-N-acetyl-D-glucosamine dehydrogenase